MEGREQQNQQPRPPMGGGFDTTTEVMSWVEPDPDMNDAEIDEMAMQTAPLTNIRSVSGPFPGPRVYRRPIRRRLHPSPSSQKQNDSCSQSPRPSPSTQTTVDSLPPLDRRVSIEGTTVSQSPLPALVSTPSSATNESAWRSVADLEMVDHQLQMLPEIEVDDEDYDEDDVLLEPKPEPLEEDVDMGTLEESVHLEDTEANATARSLASAGLFKRPRGRPRKNPLPAVTDANKVVKGRSKTGCITCRKRKKKCDEAKPRCESRTISFLCPMLGN